MDRSRSLQECLPFAIHLSCQQGLAHQAIHQLTAASEVNLGLLD